MLKLEANLDVMLGREKDGTLIIPTYVRGFYGELTITFGSDSPLAQAVLKEWQKEAQPMKTERRVEIPYGFRKHTNWDTLVMEQLDIWDAVVISRDKERTKIVIEYQGKEDESHGNRNDMGE